MSLAARRPRAPRLVVSTAVAALVLFGAPTMAAAEPSFQMPFACGQRWEGSTRSSHSPSSLSIDWNRDASDEGQPVAASARGVVTSVVDLGDSSYGRYVVVDHGGGWTSLHAHLLTSFVVVGQRVDQGQVIALLGNSGGSSGAHLHYEQRLDRTNQRAVFDSVGFVYNSWLTSRNCVDVPVVGDWNGDRMSDVGVFGRRAGGGIFRELSPDGTRTRTRFGLPTDQPVVGDWDGDGQSDPGTWSPSRHTFTLSMPRGKRKVFSFGVSGDLPVAGDWNGDGRYDVGLFRPRTRTFYLRSANGTFSTKTFGNVSSLPLAGDWDGDGRFEPGVYNPGTATFRLSRSGGGAKAVKFGTATSLPVVGFWGTDPVSDLGVWNPRTATFTKKLGAKRSSTIRFGAPR